VEPLVIAHDVADAFGGLLDYKSAGDLKDLVAQAALRVAALDRWYAQASPIWVNKNSAAFVAFTNDRVALHSRFDPALAKAQSLLTVAKYSVMTPDVVIPATDEYTALAKAMRQSYPPDGGPTTKGDWQDLFTRAVQVSPSLGIPAPTDKTIQPTAADLSGAAFAQTAGVDVVAQTTGGQATSTGPLSTGAAEKAKQLGGALAEGGGDTFNLLVWLAKHQRAVIITAAVVAGGIGLLSIMPVLLLPAKAAKGISLTGAALKAAALEGAAAVSKGVAAVSHGAAKGVAALAA
jgi:hypothetical protein